MFKKILILNVCALIASTAAASSNMLYADKQRGNAFRALTYIIATEVPPAVSKVAALEMYKNHPQDVLAELCFSAGALQLRLNNVFVAYPQAYQAPEPYRSQMQKLFESGQESLRTACAASDANRKLPTLTRVNNVENAIAEIRNEAIVIRNSIPGRP